MKPLSLVGHVTELYDQVRSDSSPTDVVVNHFVRKRRYLGAHDRRFVTDAVFGIIRHRKRLEAIIEHSLKQPSLVGTTPPVELAGMPALWLYVAYAVCIRNQPPPEVVRDLSSLWQTKYPDVDIARMLDLLSKHAELDFLPQFPVRRVATEYSYPTWMVDQWVRRFGEAEARSLCGALNQQAPLAIRVNITKASIEQCIAALQGEGVRAHPSALSPVGLVLEKRVDVHSLSAFRMGWFEVQDEGSQLLSFLVHPRPGQFVVDACAGAGGKSLHLSALMENRGQIIALDVDRRKLDELQHRCHRAGAQIVQPVLADREDPRAEESYVDLADAVLVDAPCSGTGTIRRNPARKWMVSQLIIEEFQHRQRSILARYSRLVKPGGRVVYATCSLLEEENEDVIHDFLEKNPSFQIFPAAKALKPWHLDRLAKSDFLVLWPHKEGTDGFFAAVLQRIP